MGLITKEVEVKLGGRNISYYENKGYKIPRHIGKNGKLSVKQGTTIWVDVEDVDTNCKSIVEYDCDCCKSITKGEFRQYVGLKKIDGKNYCAPCYHRLFLSGENNVNWNLNLSDEDRLSDRKYLEYTEFVRRVIKRDNYTCHYCGKRNNNIEVHHLDGYNWCKEKRVDDTNGVTLCADCHKAFHSIYGYGNNTKEQFEEWIDKKIILYKYTGEVNKRRAVYCFEDDHIYDNVEEVAENLPIKPNTVANVCNGRSNGTCGKHYIWYDVYLTMTDEEKLQWQNKPLRYNRGVICLTTNEIFNSVIEPTKIYKVGNGNIIACCRDKVNSAGKLEDGTPLQWMYYDEYLKKIQNGEKIELRKDKRYKSVICTTTGLLFDLIKNAEQKYNISYSGIVGVCVGKNKTAGQLSDGTRLQWMYYEDFLKLPQEEQNKILNRNKDLSTTDGSFII